MPVLTASERVGTTIDATYRIERMLAHGGMGVVFEATHAWTNRRVAVKLLKPDLVDPVRNARLVLEARATASLSHPNVVQVLDMGLTEDGVSYLVMELLEGRTLKDELIASGPLSPARTLALLLPVIGAMSMAHARGIIHRDLKPANIFVARDASGRETPKLLDFGIARVIEETGMTRSGAVLGTPHYLAPEQAEGNADVGPPADIWALGVILYECLAARLPFKGTPAGGVLARPHGEPLPSLRSHAPDVSSGLAAAIERALRLDPGLRYPDLASFARALLVTARAAGVVLPTAPDPLGLPDWSRWLHEDASAASTMDGTRGARVSVDAVVGPAPARRPVVRARGAVVAALCLMVAASAAAAWKLVQEPEVAPARSIANAPRHEPPPRTASPDPATFAPAPGAPAQVAAQPAAQPTAPSSAPPMMATPRPKRERAQRRTEATSAAPRTKAASTRTASDDKLIQSW